jgi:hypothetical protein
MTGVDYTILDLHLLESWILTNGKLKTVVYDNRELFKSVIFRHLMLTITITYRIIEYQIFPTFMRENEEI